MSLLIRTITVLVLGGATLALCYLFPNAAANPEAGVIMTLPDRIPGYTSEIVPVSDIEKKWLPADTTSLKRSYKSIYAENGLQKFNEAISATLILSGADAQRSLHRPEVCMNGQGWTINKREVVKLDTEGGPLEVMDLHLSRENRTETGEKYVIKAHYIYWWVGKNDSTPYYMRRIILSSMNNIFKNVNDRWAYPSVMVYAVGDDKKVQQESRQRAFEFIKRYAPTFQKSLGAK
ncbi:MAG: exosortase-associated EpsI family protein [Akkermansiaceae bacterium]